MNTVEDWTNHLEIVLGFKSGQTAIGDPDWDRQIYKKFCAGEEAFGSTGTNFAQAMMIVFRRYNPSRYEHALVGLGKSIEAKKQQGVPSMKVSKMYEELLSAYKSSGRSKT